MSLTDVEIVGLLARLREDYRESQRLQGCIWNTEVAARGPLWRKLRPVLARLAADRKAVRDARLCLICLKPGDRPHTARTLLAHRARLAATGASKMCGGPAKARDGHGVRLSGGADG